jgi:hypothetical protein
MVNNHLFETDMTSSNAIRFRQEPTLCVSLSYIDGRIQSKANVIVSQKVWQKFGHYDWVVNCGRDGTKGCYVRTRSPIDHPLYLHRITAQYFLGQNCLDGGLEVDHVQNPLVNCIQELRIATKSENAQAREGSRNSKVKGAKGVWQKADTGAFVCEYQLPGMKGVKVTKQKAGMTKQMASLLYNKLVEHHSPVFGYMNPIPIDEEPSDDQKQVVETMFQQCLKKIKTKLEKKKRRADGGDTSTDDDASSTGSPSAKRQRVE